MRRAAVLAACLVVGATATPASARPTPSSPGRASPSDVPDGRHFDARALWDCTAHALVNVTVLS